MLSSPDVWYFLETYLAPYARTGDTIDAVRSNLSFNLCIGVLLLRRERLISHVPNVTKSVCVPKVFKFIAFGICLCKDVILRDPRCRKLSVSKVDALISCLTAA